jgi:hypothetical protein
MNTSAASNWVRLPAGRFGLDASLKGVDPMWLWADATHYRDHSPDGIARGTGVWCVVERSSAACPDRWRSELLTPRSWRALRDHEGFADSMQCVELAMPVLPERPRPPRHASPVTGVITPEVSNADTLVGVIDSGCPFASSMLRAPDGRTTRVIGLWDQDDRPAFVASGGGRPDDFGYGCAIRRAGMNLLMSRARGSGGLVDEEFCYRLADYDAARGRFSHGSAVLSQIFAGPISERAIPNRAIDRRGQQMASPAVDKADLVFVQLPRAGVQDSTSAALSRYLLDGVRYIVSHARRGTTRKIVINVSSATSRTTHDGTSLVEQALSEWVDYAKSTCGIDLGFVLAMGNTNQEQRHAVLTDASQPLQLFLPPSNEMPQYVTVRWPTQAAGVRLRVTPPNGVPIEVGRGEAWAWTGPRGAEAGVMSPHPTPGRAARSLLAFAPTSSHDPRRALSPSGRWRIELVNARALDLDPVAFWISRNQRNPGAALRGRQADFIDWDERHNALRYLFRTELVTHEDPYLRNGIRRRSAMSGLATGARTDGHIVAVASSFNRGPHREATPYTSAGPAAGVGRRRLGPDFTAPADANRACAGVLVRGNSSGAVVRVSGTSFSAPQATRALINGTPYKPTLMLDGEPLSKTPNLPKGAYPERERAGGVDLAL